jgi:outer membrane protein assembly factor BamB
MPPSNTPFSQSVPVTDGERFIQGAWDSHVYAVDAETGRQIWKQACQERTFAFSPAIGAPFLSEGYVYIVANGNGLFKFNAATGEKIWEVASPGQKYGHSGPCVVGDRVFAGNLGDGEGEVRCASAKDGTEIWMAKTGFTIYDSCARAGRGFIAIHSVPGIVNALSQSDGKLLAQYRLGRGHALSTPAVREDRVFAASFSQRLVALRLRM